MKILVTGGAGFIGSALVRHLINETDNHVVNVDKLTYAGNLNSLVDVADAERYQFLQCDIVDRDNIAALFSTYAPDAVMHLAAESHVDRSIDAPQRFIETNLMGTFTLLDAARSYWETLPRAEQDRFRFLHVSTDEVFGDLTNPAELFSENSRYRPSSPYAASKAGSDHLVRAWCRTYGLPVLISNCSNNYGPYQFPEKLIPHTILSALDGKPLPVYGDGQQIRDWLFVDDHVRALVAVLQHGTVGETYNVGGHNELANLEVVRAVCDLLAELTDSTQDYRSLITLVEDRPGHDTRYAVDASKIQRDLGWVPAESFDTGLRKTVQWYLDNKSWWQDVLDGSYRLARLGVKNGN